MSPRSGYGAAVVTLALALAANGAGMTSDRICDSRALENARSRYAYRWYAEQYCEGFYDKPRRAGLDLISLTRGKLSFDPAAPGDLEIHAPGGGRLDGRSIRVRGFGLSPTLSLDGRTLAYQMDSVLPAGGRRRWPVGRVLGPTELDASQIGLVAWFEGDVGPIYVPVAVRQRSTEAVVRTPILISVRVPGYADWVKACLQPVTTIDLSAAEPAVPRCEWQQFGAGVSAGATVDIPLPPALEGLISITVKAKVGPEVFSLHEDFFRPPGW